jgi:hypothetical protein
MHRGCRSRAARALLDGPVVAARWIILGALSVGCTGTLSIGGPSSPGDDAGPPIVPFPDDDAAMPETDGGMPIDPPPMLDAGRGQPDAGPVDPCAGVSCGANSRCEVGACRCNEGFLESGGACVAPPAGDPAFRTTDAVCDAWRDGHVENASPAWVAGSGCDPGSMPPASIDDTVRRVNMFRWLAGLPPVSHDGSQHQAMMECAWMMDRNNALSHSPPSNWNCHTAGGASAAGRSNIALGVGTGGQAIDLYMRDWNTMSLGHRRWILSPGLDVVEIGLAGRGQCLGVFHFAGSTDREWSAYPNQGPAPIETAQDTWSFQAYTMNITSATTVTVTRDGMNLPVSAYLIGGGFGPPATMGFTPQGWTPSEGTYRVTIGNTSAGDITYEVQLVGC